MKRKYLYLLLLLYYILWDCEPVTKAQIAHKESLKVLNGKLKKKKNERKFRQKWGGRRGGREFCVR